MIDYFGGPIGFFVCVVIFLVGFGNLGCGYFLIYSSIIHLRDELRGDRLEPESGKLSNQISRSFRDWEKMNYPIESKLAIYTAVAESLPLMGILGTLFALWLQGVEDVSELKDSFAFALTSTAVALTLAICCKGLEGVMVGPQNWNRSRLKFYLNQKIEEGSSDNENQS